MITNRTLKILLVDDNPDDRAMVRGQLRANPKQRYEFIEFTTGNDALNYLSDPNEAFPDCVILDIHMPKMSGVDTLEAISQKWGFIPLPIIVLTGSGSDGTQDFDDAYKAINLGAQDFLTKNFLQSEIIVRAISNAIERFRLLEELQERQKRLHMTTEAAALGTWDLDLETNVLQWSNRSKELFGMNLDSELTLEKCFNGIHPDDRSRTEELINGFISGKSTGLYSNEFRTIGIDVPLNRWLLATGEIWNEDNKPSRFTGVLQDITERKISEQKILESEKEFRQLADSMPQLVWMNRPDGWCEFLSVQWYEYTGIQISDLLGYQWLECIHVDDRERTTIAWKNTTEEKAPYDIDFRIRRFDGAYRWFRARAVAIHNEKNEVLKWYGTCTDIQEIIEVKDAAEMANVAKSEFLANMSHEIRTPMNAIIGLANILSKSTPLSPKQSDFIKTLQLSADALLALLNDLLDISKIEARSVDLEYIPFDLGQTIQEIITLFELKAQEKNISIELDHDCLKGKLVVGDPARMRQIILNLCSNAIKFTDQGSIKIAVECQDSERLGYENISILVSDTGIGIAPKNLETIFQKFVQADSSINRKYGGTGLGLAITKTLTEVMSGTIDVKSELGKGTTFTIQFPMCVISDTDARNMLEQGSTPEVHSPASSESDIKLVLLVEDYEPNILVATTFLEGFGFDYDVARNGIEALEKVKQNHHRIAVTLMDVQMHGMNGFEATQLIREFEMQGEKERLPIIGMTAHALAGDKERCLQAGMDDYISKPFNPDELKRKIESYTDQ